MAETGFQQHIRRKKKKIKCSSYAKQNTRLSTNTHTNMKMHLVHCIGTKMKMQKCIHASTKTQNYFFSIDKKIMNHAVSEKSFQIAK